MSKHLAKILAVCALVVVMPFMAVGLALSFTEAVGVTFAIFQDGQNGTLSQESKVSVSVDGKLQTEDSFIIRKNAQVTLSFDGEGYNFIGWYQGNPSEVDRTQDPMSSKNVYKFTATGNSLVTAIRDIKRFNITFSGKNANGSNVTTQPMSAVEYGATLPTLSNSDSKIFAGWKVKGTATAPTLIANFQTTEQDVEVEAVWQENATYSVNYTLLNSTTADKINLAYSLTDGFQEYTKTREGYTFKGLVYKQTNGEYDTEQVFVYSATEKDYMYNSTKLSSIVLGLQDPALVAIWECNYPSVYMTFEVVDVDNNYKTAYTSGTEDGFAYIEGYQCNFMDIEGNNYFDLNDNLYDYVMTKMPNLENKAGNDMRFAGKIYITYSPRMGSTIPGTELEDNVNPANTVSLTFEYFMEYIEYYLELQVVENAEIHIQFCFTAN